MSVYLDDPRYGWDDWIKAGPPDVQVGAEGAITASGDFDESKHPRDERGRFGPGDGASPAEKHAAPEGTIDDAVTGRPITIHGYRTEGGITDLDPDFEQILGRSELLGPGTYMTDDETAISSFGGKVHEITVTLQNPYVVETEGVNPDDFNLDEDPQGALYAAAEQYPDPAHIAARGYDGIVLRGEPVMGEEQREVVVFPGHEDQVSLTASGDFDESKHPRDEHGRFGPGDGETGQVDWGVTTTYAEKGRVGERTHITMEENGTLPTTALAGMPGVMDEVPGEHRNKQGDAWDAFVEDVKKNGVQEPIFITVDYGQSPQISEGNHRRDAAIEAGLSTVPVQIRYFGHAEQEGTVAERLGLVQPEAQTASGEWDEAKHPRDAHGRFGEGGTDTLESPINQAHLDMRNGKLWEWAASDNAIATWSKYHDMTPEQYKAAVGEHVAKVLEGRPLIVQEPWFAAQRIIDGDRFKNQFETKISSGYIDVGNVARGRVEAELFGIESQDAADHPVYGSLFGTNEHGEPDASEMLTSWQYGDVMFQMKDDVKDRSTWTQQDSMGQPDDQTVGRVSEPGLDGMNSLWMDTHDALGWDPPHGTGYVEAQVHGPMSIDDVEKVFIYAAPPQLADWQENRDRKEPVGGFLRNNQRMETLEALTERGVPWFMLDKQFGTTWVPGKLPT